MVEFLSQFNIIVVGILASLLTGLATGAGALLIYLKKHVSKKMLDAALGVAAGVMLAATSFSLIVPAIEKGGGGVRGSFIALVGILLGGFFLDLTDKMFPDSNLMLNSMEADEALKNGARLRRVWLFIIAITIHNFPEGLAVGVGFGDGDIANGISLAIGIGLQNFPEGLAVALPLIRENYPRWKAFLIALCTGLVEPIGGLIGIAIVHVSKPILPVAMAFAAGAMIFVISHEIIPETQSDHNHSKLATHALLIGFVIMMFLDNSIG
ncbi:MAG: ZIP family metal transporter [Clostridia bacterium]|nr:ZIP family metal transporter [Clostridia bacterium]